MEILVLYFTFVFKDTRVMQYETDKGKMQYRGKIVELYDERKEGKASSQQKYLKIYFMVRATFRQWRNKNTFLFNTFTTLKLHDQWLNRPGSFKLTYLWLLEIIDHWTFNIKRLQAINY